MSGSCFTFSIALIGAQGIGKTTLMQTWKGVRNFDKYVNGAEAPVLNHPIPSTEFLDMVPIDVVVKGCPELAAHRVFLVDTPGCQDKVTFRDGVIEGRTIKDGLHGAVHLVDATQPSYLAEAVSVCERCVANKVNVLLVHMGCKVPDNVFPDGVNTLACEMNDFIAITKAFVDFVTLVHDRRKANEVLAASLRDSMSQHLQDNKRRKHLKPLPSRTLNVTIANVESEDQIPADAMRMEIVLLGAPNTGKSTFVSSLLDGFVILSHEPTTTLEVGTFLLHLADRRVVHMTMYDGPNPTRLAPHPAIGILFLDTTSMYALEDAEEVLSRLRPALPPKMCVAATKSDMTTECIVSMDELDAFAGEIDAHAERIDARKSNVRLIAQLVTELLDEAAETEFKLDRLQLLLSQKRDEDPNAPPPHTDEDLLKLFNRFDIDGNGFIDSQEALMLYREVDRAGLGDGERLIQSVLRRFNMCSDNEEGKLTFDQFCIVMCELAKM